MPPKSPIYDPPTRWDDPRVCAICAKRVGSWVTRFPLKNERTGKYHSGGEWGDTDCGRDATADHYLWPL
jgi:hypothetical protein